MSYIVSSGSKQYTVDYGQKFVVDYLKERKEGDEFEMPVLFSYSGSEQKTGIMVKVLSHTRGPKIRVVKYMRKSNYHRQYGFRPSQTILEVLDVTGKKSKKSTEEVVETAKVEATVKKESKPKTTKSKVATSDEKKAVTKAKTEKAKSSKTSK